MSAEEGRFTTWVASYPRSGSTWVRALLLAYQQGPDFNLNRMDGIPGEPGPSFYRALWPGKEHYDKVDWAYMRPVALRHAYEHRRHKNFVLKTHTANVKLEGIQLIPPAYTNRAVYVIRDPRDVLCSCARYFGKGHEEMLKLMGDPKHALTDPRTEMLQFVSSYANHVQGWTRKTDFPVHVVRYASLVENPEGELGKMLLFLDPEMEIDAERIKMAVGMCCVDTFREQEKMHGFREKPPGVEEFFGKGKTGGWREELSGELAERVVAAAMNTQSALWRGQVGSG